MKCHIIYKNRLFYQRYFFISHSKLQNFQFIADILISRTKADVRTDMRPTVYIDTLFLTNFITDLFLLCMTKKLCKVSSPIWRLICGACAGSIYAVFMFYPNISFVYSGAFRIIVSAVIVIISFKIKSGRGFLSLFSMFYLSSAALAGVTFAVFFCTDFGSKTGAAVSNGIFYIGINPLYLALGAAICYMALFAGEKIYTKRIEQHANMHTLSVTYGGKNVRIKGLIDTANAVSDPVTNTPVIICTTASVKTLFKGESFYGRLCETELTDSDKLKVELVCDTPFRLVPYHALNSHADVMLAFGPDALEIDGKKYEQNALVGLCRNALSQSAYYDALIHPRIMASL